MKRIITLLLAMITLCSAYAASCALANPAQSIYLLFPNATNYKTLSGDIAYVGSNRTYIEKQLNIRMDINDIGTHTIYVAMVGNKPIGYMHAANEHMHTGRMSIIWAFFMDGSIKSFLIPRSDDKSIEKINSRQFKKQFEGKNVEYPFVLENSRRINPEYMKPVKGYEDISSVVAFSAKKTLLINSMIFKKPINSAHLAP